MLAPCVIFLVLTAGNPKIGEGGGQTKNNFIFEKGEMSGVIGF